jgi:hypothetical protein
MPGGPGVEEPLQAGNVKYRTVADLPAAVPVFPLPAALLPG